MTKADHSTSYDAVPYSSYPIGNSHPGHTGVVARLFGLETAPPAACRVLELGCASGGNLLPMAEAYPESTFIGVDASRRQIETGQKVVEALGLKNIELRHADILEVDASWGCFDYLVCHGVFSWVPPPVQDHILQLCRDRLAPQGLAHVSYNTYPGWHMRGVIRDMMKYHVRAVEAPEEKISQARLLVDFVAEYASGEEHDAFRTLLGNEAELLRDGTDTYLFHEHLEEHNEPLYFHQFMDRAQACGLQYLGESNFSTMLSANLGEPAAKILGRADLLNQEQYMDFLRNRAFRETLLCHQDVPLVRQVDPQRIREFALSLPQKMDVDGEIQGETPLMLFVGEDGEQRIRSDDPVTKAVLICLNDAWPAPYTFDELCRDASARMDNGLEIDTTQLAVDLMGLYSSYMLSARIDPPTFVGEAGEKPLASPLARYQVKESHTVTNRCHQRIQLEQATALLLARLDGETDRTELCAVIREALASGVLVAEWNGKELDATSEVIADDTLEELVDIGLQVLARTALLISG